MQGLELPSQGHFDIANATDPIYIASATGHIYIANATDHIYIANDTYPMAIANDTDGPNPSCGQLN